MPVEGRNRSQTSLATCVCGGRAVPRTLCRHHCSVRVARTPSSSTNQEAWRASVRPAHTNTSSIAILAVPMSSKRERRTRGLTAEVDRGAAWGSHPVVPWCCEGQVGWVARASVPEMGRGGEWRSCACRGLSLDLERVLDSWAVCARGGVTAAGGPNSKVNP